MSKILIIAGIFLIVLGVGWSFGLGRLPGDIAIKRSNSVFYFPIVSSIIISIILTIVASLFFRNR